MKIIQSFWTKPFLQSESSLMDSRLNGGWPLRKYNYFSWTLSCLQLLEFYSEIELITDTLGKFILIDKLKLPYAKTHVKLNKLDHYDSALWALGKIYSYQMQTEPFLHIDNDIFIWNSFSPSIMDASLVTQNIENKSRDYAVTFNNLCEILHYIPDYLKELKGREFIPCTNTGIIGGTDINFFQTYTKEVFEFINQNFNVLQSNVYNFSSAFVNVIFEQIIFNQLTLIKHLPVTYLFPDHDDIPKNLGYFHAKHQNNDFIHALGTYKYNRLVYRMLEITLKTKYPEYYYRILQLVDSSEI